MIFDNFAIEIFVYIRSDVNPAHKSIVEQLFKIAVIQYYFQTMSL